MVDKTVLIAIRILAAFSLPVSTMPIAITQTGTGLNPLNSVKIRVQLCISSVGKNSVKFRVDS